MRIVRQNYYFLLYAQNVFIRHKTDFSSYGQYWLLQYRQLQNQFPSQFNKNETKIATS